ncbi:MAG TPA: cell division protein ZapA [Caulobacteraceae bacterium]|jgi:cell division protein ZapA
MAELTVRINGKPYLLGCDDGEEAHLTVLAQLIDEKVRQAAAGTEQLGETRLMLMGALVLADEQAELEEKVASAEAEVARLRKRLDAADASAIGLLEAAAKKIEGLAVR